MTPQLLDALTAAVGPGAALVIRFAGYLGFTLAAAVLAARAFGWTVGRRGRRLAVAGVVVLVLTTVVTVLSLAAGSGGVPPVEAGAALARIGVLVGLACFLPDLALRPQPWHRVVAAWFVAALAVVLIIPDAHPSTAPAAIGWILVGLHLVAVAGWAAALLGLAVPLLDPPEHDFGRQVLDLLRRTGRVLIISVLIIVATGAARWLLFPPEVMIEAMVPLAVKALLFVALVLVSAATRRRARRVAFRSAFRGAFETEPTPGAAGGTATLTLTETPTETAEAPEVAAGLRRLLVLEIALGVLVFGAAALLATATL